MNKKIRIIFLLIIVVFFIWQRAFVFAFFNFYYAQTSFKNGKIQIAAKHYKTAFELNPTGKIFEEKYFQFLMQAPLIFEVQEALYEFSKVTKNSQYQRQAEARLDRFKKIVLTQFERNYIRASLYENSVLRWNEKTFPLKVYISKSIGENYFEIVKSAFAEWEQVSDGFFKFEYVASKELADICVDFEIKITMPSDAGYYVGGSTIPLIESGQLLKRMDISINKQAPDGSVHSDEIIFLNLLHEIGHSLGIMGHSSNYHDLMYINADNKFSQADINTIRLLYFLAPAITNTPCEELEVQAKIYAPIALGDKILRDSEKYDRAVAYLQKTPDISAGWAELAMAYYADGEYNLAIKSLKHAMKLAQTVEELFYINHNIAVIYFEIKDFPNAIKYSEAALKLKSNPQTETLLANSLLKDEQKNDDMKKLTKIFEKNP